MKQEYVELRDYCGLNTCARVAVTEKKKKPKGEAPSLCNVWAEVVVVGKPAA